MKSNLGKSPRRQTLNRPAHRHPVRTRCLPGAALLGLLLLGAAGCQENTRPLQPSQLNPAERSFIERMVSVERAKGVALVHREAGEALLDSLAAAWGDSAKPETIQGLSGNPSRAMALDQLLLRVLSAEQESLQAFPGLNRLHLPLPPPAALPGPATPTG